MKQIIWATLAIAVIAMGMAYVQGNLTGRMYGYYPYAPYGAGVSSGGQIIPKQTYVEALYNMEKNQVQKPGYACCNRILLASLGYNGCPEPEQVPEICLTKQATGELGVKIPPCSAEEARCRGSFPLY